MTKKKSATLIRALFSLFALCFLINVGSLKAQAATAAQKEACKQELIEMLYSADATTHDLSKYRLTASEFNSITSSLKNGECRLIWASYYSNMYFNYTTFFSRVTNVNIANIDDDVLNRYEVLKKNVEEIMAGLRDDMTDLDKLIYFHDCIVNIATYRYVDYQSYGTCGILGDEEGVCAGYTKALNMLLDMEGITGIYTSSKTLDHGWNRVKIDGEWYHVDATWDDTRSATKGLPGHQHLLRNDEEFSGWKSHVDWYDAEYYLSTSTRFTNWFVHDITGNMLYENTYWYYVDNATNNIMKAKATGEDMQILVNGEGHDTFTILSVNNGVVTYSCNGKQYSSDDAPIIEPEAPIESETDIPEADTTEPQVPEISETPSVPDTSIETEEPVVSETTGLLNINLRDYNSWKMQKYNADAKTFVSSQTHLGLGAYQTIEPSSQYTVSLSDPNLAFRIYELDQDYNLIVQHSLPDATSFVTAVNCEYVAIELYCPANEWNYSSKSYKNLFANSNLSIGITKNTKISFESTHTWNNINGWRLGRYNITNGTFALTPKTRICLDDYIYTKPKTTYTVSLNNSKYKLTVVQYDAFYQYISGAEYADGASFKAADNCAYLGVSLYSPSLEWTLNFSSYEDLFANGFVATLVGEFAIEEELAETESEAPSLYPNISGVNLKDYTNWKMGQYNSKTVLPESSSTRVCLNSYYTVLPSTRYIASISADDLSFCVYEMTADMEVLTVHTIPNGGSFVTSANCRYVAIELFCHVNEWNWSAKNYKTNLFGKSNLMLGLTAEQNPAPLNTIQWNDVTQWRTGYYKDDTGLYTKRKTRICLHDYLYIRPGTTFQATVNDSSYRLLVVQYDENYNYLSSQTLKDSEALTTDENCYYLGVSIYSPTLEWTLNYASYESLFANDFEASLFQVVNIDDTNTPAAGTIPTDFNMVPLLFIALVCCILLATLYAYKRKKRS